MGNNEADKENAGNGCEKPLLKIGYWSFHVIAQKCET
jgi:hypothetical protein